MTEENKNPVDRIHNVFYGDDGSLRFSVVTKNGEQMTLNASSAAAKEIADLIYLELSKAKNKKP